MRLIFEAVGLLFGLVLLVWGVRISTAPQDEKAVIFCQPVHYAVNGVGYGIATATNADDSKGQPWQDSVRLFCLRRADKWFSVSAK